MSKKMFSTEDDETRTNERIKDKYRNCILIQCSAEKRSYVSSGLTPIKVGCTVMTRKTWTHASNYLST